MKTLLAQLLFATQQKADYHTNCSTYPHGGPGLIMYVVVGDCGGLAGTLRN
jgi:hypothetical protein